MSVLKGKAMWCSIQEPNTKFEPMWCCDLIVDDKTAKEFSKAGHKVRTNEETGEKSIKFKRKVTTAKGKANRQPVVVDANRNPFTELIGNGSVVNVQYKEYEWNYAGKSGKGLDLQGVQVVEHKPFAGADGAEFEAEESEFI